MRIPNQVVAACTLALILLVLPWLLGAVLYRNGAESLGMGLIVIESGLMLAVAAATVMLIPMAEVPEETGA